MIQPIFVVEKQIVSVVKDVAHTLGGNVKKTESELLAKLLNNTKQDSAQTGTGQSLGEIFKGMKIERDAPAQEQVSRSQQVRQILQMVKNQQRKEQPLRPSQRHARSSQRTPSAIRDTRYNFKTMSWCLLEKETLAQKCILEPQNQLISRAVRNLEYLQTLKIGRQSLNLKPGNS